MTSLAAVLEVPALLSVAQTGQVLGCSVRTVRRRIADGTLPAVLEHDRVMIRGDELLAYVDKLERPTHPAAPRRRHRPQIRDYGFLRE